jgi:hypothetical protein
VVSLVQVVNQESDVKRKSMNATGKPVLDQEGFQHLLAAAYILQVYNDRRPSVQTIGAGHTSPFAAGAIVQKRTPSVMIREPQLQAGQPDAVPFRSPNNSDKFTGRTDQPRVPASPEMAPVVTEKFIANEIAKEHLHPGRLVPPVEPTVLHRMNILLRRPMSWRTVEALAIAIVFCMMMGVSIHRLSALPGRTSLPSGMLEQRNASQSGRPTAKVLASFQQPVVTGNSRQSPDGGEADIVAEDIVIRYQKRAVNLPGQVAKKPTSSPVQAQLLPPKNTTSKPGVRLTFGRDADMLAAETLVQYGADVKMWSRDPKRPGLDRLEH